MEALMNLWLSLSEADFEDRMAKAVTPVLLDFSAPWCQPCKRLEPELEKLAAQLAGTAAFYTINVDEAPNLAAQLQVMGVPTVILLVNGQEAARTVGYQPLPRLLTAFSPHLGS